jgi:Flp pilus assembly protein TadB
MTAFFALLGALGAVGLLLVASGLGLGPRRGNADAARGASRRTSAHSASPAGGSAGPDWRSPQHVRLAAVALLAGALGYFVTHWPMAVPICVLAVLGSEGLGGGSGRKVISRLEAIATWTEMLRDTLSSAAGLNQALLATAAMAPEPIGLPVARLAARMTSGVPLSSALVACGDELADPAADTVVACLVMAATERAQRLNDLLGAMAAATREEVDMRLRIESSRASGRTAVRTVTGFSLGFFLLMALFALPYMAPYTTAAGQMVLGVVGILFGLGLMLMARMVRPESFSRLPVRRPDRDALL